MILSKVFFPFRLIWKDLHGLSLCTLLQSLFHQLKMIWTWDICCAVFACCILCAALHLGILDLSRCFCCLFNLCKELFIVIGTDHELRALVLLNVLLFFEFLFYFATIAKINYSRDTLEELVHSPLPPVHHNCVGKLKYDMMLCHLFLHGHGV